MPIVDISVPSAPVQTFFLSARNGLTPEESAKVKQIISAIDQVKGQPRVKLAIISALAISMAHATSNEWWLTWNESTGDAPAVVGVGMGRWNQTEITITHCFSMHPEAPQEEALLAALASHAEQVGFQTAHVNLGRNKNLAETLANVTRETKFVVAEQKQTKKDAATGKSRTVAVKGKFVLSQIQETQ